MNSRILLGNGRFPVHRQVPVPGRTSRLVPRRLAGAHALPLEPATQVELPPFGTVLREESAPPVPLPSPQDASLIVRRTYTDGPERPEADTAPERAQANEKDDTFTSRNGPPMEEHAWKAPRDTERAEENPPANREKAGTKAEDSPQENPDEPGREDELQWESLSPETKQRIHDLLLEAERSEEEPPPFSEEERRDLREPDF